MSSDTLPIVADSSFFSSLKSPATFFLMRHGRSEGNVKRIFQGKLDCALDEEGAAQAREAGAWLASQGVSRIVSSPLKRAQRTGAIVAEACGTRAETNELLEEIDTGVFTGLGWEECASRHPEIFPAFEARSWEAVPGAESSESLYARAIAAWTMLRDLASDSGGKLAIVSHGGFLQWMIRATFGCKSWMPFFHAANCGIFELYVEPKQAGPAYLRWSRINFVAPTA